MRKAQIFLVLFAAGLSFSGELRSQEALDRYISAALENNLVLQTRKVSLEKSMLALKEARSLFLPSSWFEGSYTLAQGGRSINIPVGDLLNPVYQTLNQLTGSNKFPTISNVNEQFLPNNFYDLRLRNSLPVINPSLKANRHVKEQELAMKENEVLIYQRELIKDIKTAYYQYLVADKAIQIFESALVVVEQNLRLNQSLLANGKSLPAYVSRAESEVFSVQTQLQNARNEKEKARAYFNMLLNRELQAAVETEEPGLQEFQTEAIRQGYDSIEGREELRSVQLYKDIQGTLLKMNKSYRVPRVNAFLDLAAQDFNFRVYNSSFFYLGGIQFTMPIYSGNRNVLKVRHSELDLKEAELTASNTRKQLEMAAFNARSNARNNYGTYLSSVKQEEAAAKYFKLIDRGYREGVNSFIELLDARNQLTQTQIQALLNKFRFLAAMADYERQTSSYALK